MSARIFMCVENYIHKSNQISKSNPFTRFSTLKRTPHLSIAIYLNYSGINASSEFTGVIQMINNVDIIIYSAFKLSIIIYLTFARYETRTTKFAYSRFLQHKVKV